MVSPKIQIQCCCRCCQHLSCGGRIEERIVRRKNLGRTREKEERIRKKGSGTAGPEAKQPSVRHRKQWVRYTGGKKGGKPRGETDEEKQQEMGRS